MELKEEIEKQISIFENNPIHQMPTIQEAQKLIDLLDGKLTATMENAGIVQYYLTLLIIKNQIK